MSAIEIALDEHLRVQRYAERFQRIVASGLPEAYSEFGRPPRPHEIADARIVFLDASLVEPIKNMRAVLHDGSLALSPVERSRLPLDRALLIVLDGVELTLQLTNSGEDTRRFGSIVLLPGIWEPEWATGLPDGQLVRHSMIPFADPVSKTTTSMQGVTFLGCRSTIADEDEGHQMIHGLVQGLSSGRLVIAEPDDISDANAARMTRARREVTEMRLPRCGDRLVNFEPATFRHRSCHNADGRPKRVLRSTAEAEAMIGSLEAAGDFGLRWYRCPTGRCGDNALHVGHVDRLAS